MRTGARPIPAWRCGSLSPLVKEVLTTLSTCFQQTTHTFSHVGRPGPGGTPDGPRDSTWRRQEDHEPGPCGVRRARLYLGVRLGSTAAELLRPAVPRRRA